MRLLLQTTHLKTSNSTKKRASLIGRGRRGCAKQPSGRVGAEKATRRAAILSKDLQKLGVFRTYLQLIAICSEIKLLKNE